MIIDDLLILVGRYKEHTGLSEATISTYAANDGKFFSRLRTGADCNSRRAERLVQWFSDNWPENLSWPDEIKRPKKTPPEKAAS